MFVIENSTVTSVHYLFLRVSVSSVAVSIVRRHLSPLVAKLLINIFNKEGREYSREYECSRER